MKIRTTRTKALHILHKLENLKTRNEWESSLTSVLTFVRTNGESEYVVIELTPQEAFIWIRLDH